MSKIKEVLNTATASALEQYDNLPDKMRMQAGTPSVPAELIDFLPLGKWVAAKLDWQSATAVSDTVSDKAKPNFGKVWFQMVVPCEVGGKTGALRLWRNEIDAALAADENGALVVSRFETKNDNNPQKPYQNLAWRNGAPTATATAPTTAEPALVGA